MSATYSRNVEFVVRGEYSRAHRGNIVSDDKLFDFKTEALLNELLALDFRVVYRFAGLLVGQEMVVDVRVLIDREGEGLTVEPDVVGELADVGQIGRGLGR